MSYLYKTQPLRHQEESFNRTNMLTAWGLFWEQGCGKTKPTIDTGAFLYQRGLIDAIVVVAPNGVHRNWINDELPKHLPDTIADAATVFHYDSHKMPSPSNKRPGPKQANYLTFCRWLIRDCDGLIIVAMSYDAVMTKRGQSFIHELLTKRQCLLVADESHYIKNPGAKRTKRLVAYSKHATYRRILTGTPMEKPFDMYSQMKFLDPDFWKSLGLGSAAAFRHYFGIWRTAKEVEAEEGFNPGYDQLLGYRHLDELRKYIQKLSHRITKDDAGLDLPPMLFSKLYFDMSKEQVAAYKQLQEQYYLELEDDKVVEADLVIVRMLRLQQITCGYVQIDAEEPLRLLSDKNPRLDKAVEYLEELPHKAIIWCRFRHDIDQLMDALGDKAVRYDGSVSGDDAEAAKNEFQEGDAKYFVGNPKKGGTGITLHSAKTILNYSSYFDLILREQALARAHRIGMDDKPLHIVDMAADHTIDMIIIKALVEKFEIACQVTGDKMREIIGDQL